MATHEVTLNPGESKVVSFKAIPQEARTYQVSVDGLAGNFTAIQPAPAKFEYASDVRKQTETDAAGRLVAHIEVDIANIGGAPGSCTATAFIRTSLGSWNVLMGTREINPGGVVTFFGTWQPRAKPADFDWIDYIHITSKAGLISFAFGRSLQLISYDIPAEIVSGSEVSAKMVLLLPYYSGFGYECALGIGNRKRCRIISVGIGAPNYTFRHLDMVMRTTGTYELTGTAKASSYYMGWAKWVPLPLGTYDVIITVIGYDNTGWWAPFVFYNAPVGQKVKVI